MRYLFFLAFSSFLSMNGLAQSVVPDQMFPEIQFPQTKDPEGRIGKWEVLVNIPNPYSKPVFCKNSKFTAFLDVYGADCGTKPFPFGILLNAAGSSEGFDIPANGTADITHKLGNDERLKKTEAVKDFLPLPSSTLEYCSRSEWDLNCGFYCPNGKKHGEEWTEVLNETGHRKYLCKRDGTHIETEMFCDSTHKANDDWVESTGNGTITNSCLSTGYIHRSVACNEPARFDPDQSSLTCSPKNCGSDIPHGSPMWEPTRNGKIHYVCDYGSRKFVEVVCPNYEWYRDAGNSCDKIGKFDRYRPGNPRIHTQCDTSTSSDLDIIWKGNCKSGQVLTFGPYFNYPFGGHYRVTFHLGRTIFNSFFGQPTGNVNPDIEAFRLDVAGDTGRRIFVERIIKRSDFNQTQIVERDGGFTFTYYQYKLNPSFMDSLIENRDNLRARIPKQDWAQITMEFDSMDAIPDLEARVLIREASVVVAGIDIEFIPYQ